MSYLLSFCRDLATNKNTSICLSSITDSGNLNIYQISFSTLFFLSRTTLWLPVVLNQCFSEQWLLSVTPVLLCLGMLIFNSGNLPWKWPKQEGGLGCIFKYNLKNKSSLWEDEYSLKSKACFYLDLSSTYP